jgi:hypothetical protein
MTNGAQFSKDLAELGKNQASINTAKKFANEGGE